MIINFILLRIRLRNVLEVHHVGHTRAAALAHTHSQAQIPALLLTQQADLASSRVGHLNSALLRLSCLCHRADTTP